MNLTRLSLSNPVAVTVGVLLVLLFGTIGLFELPIQMIPSVERPSIQINTSWRAAAPEEIESEIIEPQEDALRGLAGLQKMESTASNGSGSISLNFDIDVNLQDVQLEVMNRLTRVSNYPPDANEPTVFVGRGGFGANIAWFAVRPKAGSNIDITEYQDFVDEVIVPRIERVKGVSNSNAFGGNQKEVRISFDANKAAAFGVSISDVARLSSGNVDSSGGFTDIGRRQYTLRYAGSYELEDLKNMILTYSNGSPVKLLDIAEIELRNIDVSGSLSQNGGTSIAFNVEPETNINVLEVMAEIKAAVVELNEGPVGRADLNIIQVYDETLYIEDSIAMLRNNLLLGIALAIIILWWFLRKFRATLLVAIAIPVSLFFAFIAFRFAGRTLNIISLAGLAFAMGMVLDAAIVVLENIVRLREEGSSSEEASEHGATQVWGALLASTATTVAIFLPILFLRDIAGQLFADLAFAISVAVVISLIIAVTIIPTAANTILKNTQLIDPHQNWWNRLTKLIIKLTDTAKRRAIWIFGLLTFGILTTILLLPKASYLPEGEQNFIFAFISPPTGQSVQTGKAEFVDVVNERFKPYLSGEKQPQVDNYFLGMFGSSGFMGVRAKNRKEINALVQEVNSNITSGFPDTNVFANKAAIFGRLGGGGTIELNIQSQDIDSTIRAAQAGLGAISKALPGAQARPTPSLELATPELRLIPNERAITEAGMSRAEIASLVRALGDGLYVGDYFDGSKRRNIILRGPEWQRPEDLLATPISTPQRGIQPLGALIDLQETVGPDQIRRVDRRRSITINVTPPKTLSLEEAIERLKVQVEPAIRAELPQDGTVSYYGSADDLKVALKNMGKSFALAIIILYLLMSALFRSFKDSLLVLIALPLATVGGVLALKLVNVFSIQAMDLMTMIGFITLLGLVVNNAILLVHQTRTAERLGLARKLAVEQAVRIRLRPILMSTLTSLFGMLPLLLIPGPGTELYRGLAAVIIGGLSLSTIFTLVLLPSLLRIGEHKHLGNQNKHNPIAPLSLHTLEPTLS